jgi:hypothetical protein
MIRVLTILAAVLALAVTATPASAGLLSSPLGVSASPNCYVAGKVLSGRATIIDGRHRIVNGLVL